MMRGGRTERERESRERESREREREQRARERERAESEQVLGPVPPLLNHNVGFLTLGPKLAPPLRRDLIGLRLGSSLSNTLHPPLEIKNYLTRRIWHNLFPVIAYAVETRYKYSIFIYAMIITS